jgi:hypothetical protein
MSGYILPKSVKRRSQSPQRIEGLSRAQSVFFSRANVPQLHAHDFELGPIVTQWLIAKRRARSRHTVLEVVIKPQAIVTISVVVLAAYAS